MKVKDKESIKKEIEMLGQCVISKLSAINYLIKTNSVNVDALILMEVSIKSIECGLWSVTTLALGSNKALFEDTIDGLTKDFNRIIKAARSMRELKESL